MRRSAAPSQTGAASLAKRQKFVSPAASLRPPTQSPTKLQGPYAPRTLVSSSTSSKENTWFNVNGNVGPSSPMIPRFITNRPLSGQLSSGKNLNDDSNWDNSESTEVAKSYPVELSDEKLKFLPPEIFEKCSNNSPLVDSQKFSLFKSTKSFDLNSPQSSSLFKNVISDSAEVNVGQTSVTCKPIADSSSSDNSVSYNSAANQSDDSCIINKSELHSQFLYGYKQAKVTDERLQSYQKISNEDQEHHILPGIKSFQNSKTSPSTCVNVTINDQLSSKTFKHSIRFQKKKSESFGQFSSPSHDLDSLQSHDAQQNNSAAVGGEAAASTQYFSVVWCKMSKKKHKKWEGDAVMTATGRTVTLYDMDGKIISKSSGFKTAVLESLKEDETLFLGGKEVQVISLLSEEHFKSGKCFTVGDVVTPNLLTSNDNNYRSQTGIMGAGVSKPFVNPSLKSEQNERTKETRNPTTPRYNPNAPGALVLPRPSANHQWKYNKQGLPLVDVVVDPYLSNHLRSHQRSGVIFLYECVLGMRCFNGFGAILADDMGLGKTLQCICLIWTLLKQGPYGGHPIVSKVLVVTPGSLVKNWFAEFKKWLGTERINVFAVSTDNRVEEYIKTNVHPVLLISYEMFVRSYETIKDQHIDLVICDEGHRLKNTAIKTTSLIMSLPCRRRIVLSGTPVQNDLQEFYSIVDFCNPGILGTSATFHSVFEAPIIASQQPEATLEQKELGAERTNELVRLTHMFVLRRTQEINNDYLPPKVEMVLFCKPTPLQLTLYRQLLHSNLVRACLAGSLAGSPHLSCISALRHLCNHPGLIYRKAAEENISSSGDINSLLSKGQQDHAAEESMYSGLLSYFPASFNPRTVNTLESGKLAVLAQLLSSIWSQSSTEKVVLVSNHTKVLDVLEMFCKLQGYTFLRLDGQTPTAQRQTLVNSFNNKYSAFRIFLLSSKAGGVGLNLIGASRLVLYDIDWNPANDLQAMARVWRDGQKGKVYIYRLLTVGTIEEKMYQRQIAKQGLSGAVMDLQSRKKTSVQFSVEDLKDLFTLNEGTDCETHTMLGCGCQGDPSFVPQETRTHNSAEERQCQLGRPANMNESKKSNLGMSELLHWKHWKGEFTAGEESWRLQQAGPSLSFVFWHETLMT